MPCSVSPTYCGCRPLALSCPQARVFTCPPLPSSDSSLSPHFAQLGSLRLVHLGHVGSLRRGSACSEWLPSTAVSALVPAVPSSCCLSPRSVSFSSYHVGFAETVHYLRVVCLPPLGYVPEGKEGPRLLCSSPFRAS